MGMISEKEIIEGRSCHFKGCTEPAHGTLMLVGSADWILSAAEDLGWEVPRPEAMLTVKAVVEEALPEVKAPMAIRNIPLCEEHLKIAPEGSYGKCEPGYEEQFEAQVAASLHANRLTH